MATAPRTSEEIWNIALIFIAGLGALICIKLIVAYSTAPSDFVQDYCAGKALLQGESIYGDSLIQIASEIFPNTKHEINHAPFAAPLFMPLALLPYSIAFIIFSLGQLLLYIWVVTSCLKIFSITGRTYRTIFSLSFIWFPMISAVGSGNMSIYVAACVIFGWQKLRDGRDTAAGVLLGLATLLKLFPGLLGLYLLTSKRYRAFMAMCAVFAAGTMLSSATVGIPDIQLYYNVVVHKNISEWAGFMLNSSFTGFVTPLFEATKLTKPLFESSAWLKEPMIMSLSLLLLIATLTVQRRNPNLDRDFALYTASMLLVCPITWMHILPVLIPGLLIVSRGAGSIRVYLLGFVILFFSYPDIYACQWLINFFKPEKIPWYAFLIHKLPFYGLIIHWCLLATTEPDEFGIEQH